MTVKVINLREMQHMVDDALKVSDDGSHADVYGELLRLRAVLERDAMEQGCSAAAEEAEIGPLLIPYVQMLTRAQPMVMLVVMNEATSVYITEQVALLCRDAALCVVLPVPFPQLKEAIAVAMLPLTRQAGAPLEVDYTIHKLFG